MRYERKRHHPPRPFRCPCCRQPGGFCSEHKEVLAGIAARLDAETHRLTRDGLRARSPQAPTCTTMGCWGSRVPPSPFCESCLEGAE